MEGYVRFNWRTTTLLWQSITLAAKGEPRELGNRPLIVQCGRPDAFRRGTILVRQYRTGNPTISSQETIADGKHRAGGLV